MRCLNVTARVLGVLQENYSIIQWRVKARSKVKFIMALILGVLRKLKSSENARVNNYKASKESFLLEAKFLMKYCLLHKRSFAGCVMRVNVKLKCLIFD